MTDEGIVLIRQNFREADRMVSLYTKSYGRLNLRFPSVNKSAGKLKALSEPFVHANYRIYVKRGAVIGCVTGGKIESVFPQIRQDGPKTKMALHFCELMFRLTPEHQPSEEKFLLLQEALNSLQKTDCNPSLSPAFILRLMTLAGFGMDKPALGIPAAFWETLHNADFENLGFTSPQDLLNLNKSAYICRRFLNRYLTYPLNTLKDEDISDMARNLDNYDSEFEAETQPAAAY
ncbi:DNA repair protein RecO [Elusimicrobium minutum Pei191]|uniref:DNA repair protein RecO n=2 Tax=Elusimicrobium TaxID=423604 RepID=B2KBR3_ELUMP|nr:DNA repair protein RecO [Elusimicrobium minutum Pei191]